MALLTGCALVAACDEELPTEPIPLVSIEMLAGGGDSLMVGDTIPVELRIRDSVQRVVPYAELIASSSDTSVLQIVADSVTSAGVWVGRLIGNGAGAAEMSATIAGGVGVARTAPFRTTVTVLQRWIAIELSDGPWQDYLSDGTLTCGLSIKGEAYCWGRARRGLGDGTLASSSVPLAVLTEARFQKISVGEDQACAISTQGQLMCWGAGSVGELGNGMLRDQLLPEGVAWGFLASAVTLGANFACALADDRATYCWGSARFAQPANIASAWVKCRVENQSQFECAPAPGVAVLLGDGPPRWCLLDDLELCRMEFSVISAGTSHACGIATFNGAALCWGQNGNHLGGPEEPGRCALASSCSPPTVVGGDPDWHTRPFAVWPIYFDISAGNASTCGLRTDSLAYCWGNLTGSRTPTLISSSPRFQKIYVGNDHACGLTAARSAYCWGSNSAGQLGVGPSVPSSSVPLAVVGDIAFAYLSAGDRATCGVSIEGVGYCWGAGISGRLGNGTNENRFTPTRIAEP